MSKPETIKKERLTVTELLAIGGAVLAFLGAAYEGGKNYGYHSSKSNAPNYLKTHQGINPADIIRDQPDK